MGLKIKRNKKAFFFTLDSFVSVLVILMAALLITSLYIYSRPTGQLSNNANDMVMVLAELKVSEIDSTAVQQMIANGTISRPNQSVLMQLGEFYAMQRDDLAALLYQEFTNLTPDNFGNALFINDLEIYSDPPDNTTGQSVGQAESSNLLTSKNLLSGYEQNRTTFGYVSRASILKTSTEKKQYIYFGGYIGDGNISSKVVMPSNFTEVSIYMEVVVPDDFDLYINGVYSGSYSPPSSSLEPINETLDSGYLGSLVGGENIIELRFNNVGYVGGGFIEIVYDTEDLYFTNDQTQGNITERNYWFDAVDTNINIFDSFYMPGIIQNIEIFLNYTTEGPVLLTIGDQIVYLNTDVGDIEVTLDDSDLLSLNYSELSDVNVPLRLGHSSMLENLTNATNESVDAILITDVSGSMSTEDIPDAPGQSRLEVAKDADDLFVDIILNYSANQVGLVSYDTALDDSTPLTNNAANLHSAISSYTANGYTCICCGIEEGVDLLQSSSADHMDMLVMSDGEANRRCTENHDCVCVWPWGEWCFGWDCTEAAKNDAIDFACNAKQNHNITVHAVAFGADADTDTLEAIAACGGGEFFQGSNYSELLEAYQHIAETILNQLTFHGQIINVTTFASELYTGSYISFNFTPTHDMISYGDLAFFERTPYFQNNITEGNFTVPLGATLHEVYLSSYSGGYWTAEVNIDNGSGYQNVFDIDDYGSNYEQIGDPFIIYIPPSMVAEDNDVQIYTAFNSTEPRGGSEKDRAFYTYSVNVLTNYSEVLESSVGCTWFIEFEDGSSTYINVPPGYNGTNSCNYRSATYNTSDALDVSAYELFDRLDLDDDGYVDVKISQSEIAASTLEVGDIPSLWGPAVIEVRSWQ